MYLIDSEQNVVSVSKEPRSCYGFGYCGTSCTTPKSACTASLYKYKYEYEYQNENTNNINMYIYIYIHMHTYLHVHV